MAVKDYKINYKSDFVLTVNGDAGWSTQFCIKFWTGMPSQAYFVGFDGVKYVNCRVGDTPTQLLVMFDDHHLPIGKLMMQIAYHTTIEEFPGSVFDEVTNARDVIVTIDGTDYQVLLDFTGEDAPELEFDLPAYANEAERIQNELQRQQNEADRIAAELEREQASAAAVAGAENVNAQLNGTTLTVTNRQGVSTSVNTKGEQGEQGPVGPEGPQGEQGETGISIVSFTPKSETSTTLIYTVTFSDGTTQDVPIPKGAKGDTGATGPQGPQGDTGVSIVSFTQTGSTTESLIYTVTFSDSTIQQVAIPKGEKGDTGPQGPVGPQGPQGPMGDVAVITPEQQAAFTMYSVPGQNTDGPMTQKAVTDNLVASAISYDNSQSGLASNNVQGAVDEVGRDIQEDGTPYNLNNYPTYNGGFTDTSWFWWRNVGAGKHKAIPVTEGDTFHVTAHQVGGDNGGYCGWLTSSYTNGNQTHGASVPYVSGTTRFMVKDSIIVAPAGAAWLILTVVDGAQYSVSNNVVQSVRLKDIVEPIPTISENCKNVNGGTETKKVSIRNTDIGNSGTNWQALIKGRLALNKYMLIDVRGCSHINCVLPYSTVSADSRIDRVTIPLYDEKRDVLVELDLGWFYFNGSSVTINIDLTQSAYKDVAYAGIYFGCSNTNTQILSSSLNMSVVQFTLTMKDEYYTPAANSLVLNGNNDVRTITEDDLVAEHYTSYVKDNSSRGLYLIDVSLLGDYSLSLSVASGSTIKVGVQKWTELNKMSSIIELDNGYITQNTSYTYSKGVDLQYIGLVFTYTSNGNGIPTINEIHQYVTFSFTYKGKGLIERVQSLEKRSVLDLLDRSVNIISHVGGGSWLGQVAPLNSMWSAMLAARMGLRVCEFDIVFTSDDVPICCHDLTLNGSNHEFAKRDGSTISNLSIGSLTYSDLISTYVYKNGYAGYKEISTMQDVLAVHRDNNIIPCIEVKNPASEMTDTRYSVIISALDKYIGDRCMCITFDKEVAIRLRGYSKDMCIGILDSSSSDTMIDYAKRFNFFAGINISNITSTIVDTYRDNGIPLNAWTVDSDVDSAIKLGLRMITCNNVAEPNNNCGVIDSQISNAVDFSNITNTGTVTDGILTLASGETATITSNTSSWLSSIEMHVIIKGTCTIVVNGNTFNVSHSDYAEYVILNKFHDTAAITATINGVCEIVGINAVIKSY